MNELSIEEKVKRYDESLKEAFIAYKDEDKHLKATLERIFPELAESEDERIRKAIHIYLDWLDGRNKDCQPKGEYTIRDMIAWLEKQGAEPNWCHHKVDLSNCSEEYRKAYYDGWNNCNMQHSQCKSDGNDVVKCLINGMKFYYEDDEEATWGTEKFSMKVKDILSWLEKQGEQKPTDEEMKELLRTEYEKGRADAIAEMQKPVDCTDCTNSKGCINCEDGNMKETLVQKTAWSEEDETRLTNTIIMLKEGASFHFNKKDITKTVDWLKSLKDRIQPQPKQEWSEEDSENLEECVIAVSMSEGHTLEEKERLENWLKAFPPQKQCGYNPYKEVVESIAEMCEKYKLPTSDLSDFLDNVRVKCKEAKEYDAMFPHKQWKPSDEQIQALHNLNLTGNISYAGQGQVLIELQEQLKKLREE